MKKLIFILSSLVFMLVSCAGNDFTSFNSGIEDGCAGNDFTSFSSSGTEDHTDESLRDRYQRGLRERCVAEISSPIVYSILTQNNQYGQGISHCHKDRSVTYCNWSGSGVFQKNTPNRCRGGC